MTATAAYDSVFIPLANYREVKGELLITSTTTPPVDPLHWVLLSPVSTGILLPTTTIDHTRISSHPASWREVQKNITASLNFVAGITTLADVVCETSPYISNSIALQESRAYGCSHVVSPVKLVKYNPLEEAIKSALLRGATERFEAGMDSNLTLELGSLVRFHSTEALLALGSVIREDSISVDVISEVMRWLGRFEGSVSLRDRANLLAWGLASDSLYVRDAAACGFGSLDDPIGITFLDKAVQRESSADLREDMEQVLQDLKSSQTCLVS